MDDDLAYQVCYVFKRTQSDEDETDRRPKKKRKVSAAVSTLEEITFPRLAGGREPFAASKARHELFQSTWTRQEALIDNVINNVSDQAFQDIVQFVGDCTADRNFTDIPTGLIVSGPNSSLRERLMRGWTDDEPEQRTAHVITIDSSQMVNITTALKHIIRSCITQVDGADAYQAFLAKHRRLVPMSFDLELLRLFVLDRSVEKIVVSVLDVESVDVGVLSELISTLVSWLDRLHFVMLLGIATTVELLEARLSKSTIRLLHPRVFDFSNQSAKFYDILHECESHVDNRLWLGPVALNTLREMANEQETSPETFKQALKYTCMSHFFANPLSLLLSEELELDAPTARSVCEAIRNTASFKAYIEETIDEGRFDLVNDLLNDDEELLKDAKTAIRVGQAVMRINQKTLWFLRSLINLVQPMPETDDAKFELNVQMFSPGAFVLSSCLADIQDSILRLPSDEFANLLQELTPMMPDSLARLHEEISSSVEIDLAQLVAKSQSGPIRSVRDPCRSTSATSLANQTTTQPTRSAPKLSTLERAYSGLLEEFVKVLTKNVTTLFRDPKSLVMNEVFMYDLKMPLSGVFAPRPRFAIERALERPGDYLGCDCCNNHQTRTWSDHHASRKGASAPPTCILWQLWCEAGSTVNVRDLWETFRSILVPSSNVAADETDEIEVEDAGSTSKEGTDERKALALFYRSLAELRMLGFVKTSSRKAGVECLAKTTWRGI